jgi:hypothetical protein
MMPKLPRNQNAVTLNFKNVNADCRCALCINTVTVKYLILCQGGRLRCCGCDLTYLVCGDCCCRTANDGKALRITLSYVAFGVQGSLMIGRDTQVASSDRNRDFDMLLRHTLCCLVFICIFI